LTNGANCFEEIRRPKVAQTERNIENGLIVQKSPTNSLLKPFCDGQLSDSWLAIDVDDHRKNVAEPLPSFDVGSWHKASFCCPASIWSLLEKSRRCGAEFAITRLVGGIFGIAE
jgi:hypothetical protein